MMLEPAPCAFLPLLILNTNFFTPAPADALGHPSLPHAVFTFGLNALT